MPRRLKLIPRELGELQLYLIYAKGGDWEQAWKPLQGHPVGGLFTKTTKIVLDHALAGWSRPLVDALGIPPQGALRKLPEAQRQCVHRAKCSLYIARDCVPAAAKMPWCFQPSGMADEKIQQLVADAIRLWREGVYIVVVSEEP